MKYNTIATSIEKSITNLKLKFLLIAIIIATSSSNLIGQTFTDVTSSTNLPTSIEYWKIQAYDFNNDNNVDVIYPSLSSSNYSFYKNNGNGTFSDITTSSGLQISKNYELRFADINKDGLSDIIAMYDSSSNVIIRVFKQVTANFFINYTTNLNIVNPIQGFGVASGFNAGNIIDYDMDGDLDILYATSGSGNRSIKALKANLSNGNITYDSVVTVINLDAYLQANERPLFLIPADYDNDGDEDIVYARWCNTCGLQGNGNFYGHKYALIRNDGNGLFTEISGTQGIGNFARVPFVCDYNNDGKFDLVAGCTDNVSNITGSRVYLYQGNGDGTFNNVTTSMQMYDGVSRYYRVFGVSDYNNDGYQDILSEIDGGANPQYKLFKNNTGLNFTNVASSVGLSLNTSFLGGGHVWFDYDNDGDVDLFANVDRVLKVYKNNLTNKNWLKVRLYGCSNNADAYGVRVEVKFAGKKIALTPSQGFDRITSVLHTGLDTVSIIDSVIVYWQTNNPTYYTNVSVNQTLKIYESGSTSCYQCIGNITSDGPTTFCAGNYVNLTSDVVGGTYQWKKNGVNVTSNGTSRTYKATASGSYTCIATCNGTALTSNAIAVSAKTNAFASVTASGATSFCAGDSVTLNCTNLGSNYSVQWYRTNVSMENATNYSQVVKQPGTYKVVTRNLTNGCSRISGSAITTNVNCRIANNNQSEPTSNDINEEARTLAPELSQGVNLFPNPNNGSFKFTYEGEVEGEGTIQVISAMGQVIYQSQATAEDGHISKEIFLGDQYQKGIYIVRLLINGGQNDSRMIVQ